MTSDPARNLKGKREFRQRLAARPIEEKLAMLDALRGSALVVWGKHDVATLREMGANLLPSGRSC
jgi:hypothetical protein